MPAPISSNSGARSNTATSAPARRSATAAVSPPIPPPAMMALVTRDPPHQTSYRASRSRGKPFVRCEGRFGGSGELKQRLGPHELLRHGDQLLGSEGLAQDTNRAVRALGEQPRSGVLFGGGEDHRDLRGLGHRLQAVARFHAPHVGHRDIHNDEVHLAAKGLLDGTLSVRRPHHLEPCARERLRGGIQRNGVVVGEHYGVPSSFHGDIFYTQNDPSGRIRRRGRIGVNSGVSTGEERRAREVSVTEQKYFRKGFKMRDDVQHLLDRDYRSEVVDRVRENGNVLEVEGLIVRLADEFGFCYGVDRAVDYAFQTREKFPDRRIHITGDMIHNASMNDRLREMGIEFLSQGFEGRPDEKFDSLGPEDVILLPAFGAPVDWVEKLRQRGCIVVDTTCGSVLSVWKRVTRYAGRGFTSIIHGKYYHEETKATASQTLRDGGNGKYLIVRNLKETGY